MMLEWLGRKNNDQSLLEGARMIEDAVYNVFSKNIRTSDVGGSASTTEFGDAVVSEILK